MRALGLRDLAADVARGLRGAGFTAPAGAGAMVVARTLGLHYNHPPGSDARERFPGQAARRGDGAYATWKVLAQQGWELGFARQHLGGLSIPPVPAGALPALARAVAEIGAPYVWGGESHAEGGFDCSGLVVNVEVDAAWLGGRTTRDMARATPRPVTRRARQGRAPATSCCSARAGGRRRTASSITSAWRSAAAGSSTRAGRA